TWILSAGVFVWSLFTAVSGVAKNYGQLFAFRLGVGVGEASCAPAATSLIGDLFPAARRGKALSVFMLGLPLGVAASFAVSSWVTQRWGWRPSFYVAAILGGISGDAVVKRRANGRLLVGAISVLLGVPLVYFALTQPAGATVGFTVLLFLGWALMYVYYATVYSTIQDVIEPSLRGTAMALYFFAMYVLGASLGPIGMGYLSSHFTTKAA